MGARGEIGRQWRLDLRSASLQPGTGANCTSPLQGLCFDSSPRVRRSSSTTRDELVSGNSTDCWVLRCDTARQRQLTAGSTVSHCCNRLLVLHCHTAATDCWFYTVTLLQQTAGSTLSHCCNRLLVLQCHTENRLLVLHCHTAVTLSHCCNRLLVLHCYTGATYCWFYTVTLLQQTAGSTLSH